MTTPPPKTYEFGPFRVDLTERLVLKKGKPVALTPKAFDVLALLIERRGHLVEKEELMNEIWTDCFVEDANLTRTIWMLRQALDDDRNGNGFIQTVPKHGYRFVAELKDPRSETKGQNTGPFNGHPPDQTGNIDNQAYELFLRGRYHLRRETEESVQEAIALQEQATRLSPNFALAFTELARAYHLNAYYYTPEEAKWDEKAWVACEWALTLDPQLGEAHFVRGLLLWTHANGFPHEQVIEEYKRALKLNSDLDEAHHQLGLVLHHIGLLDHALVHYEKALAINPANNIVRARFAIVGNFKHQYEETMRIVDTLPPDITPGLYILKGMALCHLYRLDEAQNYTENWLESHPRDDGGLMTSIQAMIAALRGDKGEALARIQHSIEIGHGYGHFHHSTYNIAAAFSLLQMPDDAIKWLEFTFNDGFPCYPMIDGDPFLENLHCDPRFIALMSKQREVWDKRMASY
jgi:DNA-binding winged helix-turn-helix (wHTH) protein